MKIGVLTHNYPRFSGDFSGRFVEALSEELVTQGHDVTVIAPWDAAYARTAADHRVRLLLYRYAPRADWHRLGYMRTMRADVALRGGTYLLAPGLFIAGARAALRWTSQERPDVLHAHWTLPNGFMAALAARRYRVPLVVSIPGSDATVAGQNPVFRRMAKFAFDQAGLITANSAALRDVAVGGLGADPAKFDLIAYGVDPNAYLPDPAGTGDLRASLGIPPEAIVFLAVGRMVYKKGFDRLIRAAALMANSEWQMADGKWPVATSHQPSAIGHTPPVHLVMVGEGDLWAEWQALGRELGLAERLHWVGNVPADRLGVYYNMADALVMPSVTHPADGLNVTVLDAMSCARPVVGTNAAGNELAIRDGDNGFLVPEGDDAALAGALATLAADPDLRARMGAAGRQRIETELGWPHLARRYVTHFERLAGNSAHAWRHAGASRPR
jgi:glycosyltransferase involved in cell wall biosynthesis